MRKKCINMPHAVCVARCRSAKLVRLSDVSRLWSLGRCGRRAEPRVHPTLLGKTCKHVVHHVVCSQVGLCGVSGKAGHAEGPGVSLPTRCHDVTMLVDLSTSPAVRSWITAGGR